VRDDAQHDTILRLAQELDKARHEYDLASKRFNAVMSDVPSGLPHPDGAYRLERSGKESRLTLDLYTKALRRYSEFLLYGVIPED